MFRKLHQLFTGVVLIATVLTVLVYLWALNSSTIYERAESARIEHEDPTP